MRQNFHTLIIAGLGAVGSSIIKLGAGVLASFDQVIGVDLAPGPLDPSPGPTGAMRFLAGDIEDHAFLSPLLTGIRHPSLFLNVCAGVDNVLVRSILASRDTAYIDTCACVPRGSKEHRFSRMMPYSLTPVKSRFPHWLCWGINPGLVELVARRLIAGFDDRTGPFDITVFEYDQLHDPAGNKTAVPVGWCPEAFIEETMLSPTLEFRGGKMTEAGGQGADRITACWAGMEVDSRVVAHEDIWNMGVFLRARNARFVYGLHPRVMRVLAGAPETAAELLRLPHPQDRIRGKEQVAVVVRHGHTGEERSLVWEVDHGEIWRRHGINGVQYQTAKSILLAVLLLQHTAYGTMAGDFCAAGLPAAQNDWRKVETFMADLGITWQEAGHLELRTDGRA